VTCRELVELVTDYFEGALPDEDVRRFEDHIDLCDLCARYLAQMRLTIDTVGRIPEESISAEAKDTLLHAFRDWHVGEPPLRER
jgi:anti-sigma factor RsiW